MQNEFIEELRKKARETEEDKYRKKMKQEYPCISDENIRKQYFEDIMVKMFNPKGGEER